MTDLVGRVRERETLRTLLHSATSAGQLAIITGDAGIGKSTLIRELIARAEERGYQTMFGACYDGLTTAPYEPWHDALISRERNAIPTSHDLISHLGEFLPENAQIGDERSLMRSVTYVLENFAAERPVLLVLEDMHWADAGSVELLVRMANVITRIPILLVATWRDAEGAARKFPTPLISLARLPSCTWIPLQRLGEDETDRWIRQQYKLGDDAHRRLAEFLSRYAGGNPLFLVEIFRELELSITLRHEDGVWVLGDLRELVLPPVVQQLISARFETFDPDTRKVLDVCAVLGQVFPSHLLRDVTGATAESLATAITIAQDAQILKSAQRESDLEFQHALTREVLYRQVSEPVRQEIHGRAADVLLAMDDPDPGRVSAHLLAAGDLRASEWLLRAGDRAERTHAWSDAVQRYEQALESLSFGPETARFRGWLHFRVACLLRYRDLGRARDAIDDAIEIAQANGELVLLAYGRYVRGVINVFAKNWKRGIAELLDAIVLLERLPPVDRLRLNSSPGVFNPDALPLPTSRFQPPDNPEPRAGPLLGDIDRRATVASFLAESGRLDEALELTLLDGDSNRAGSAQTGHMLHTSAFAHALAGRPLDSEADYERAERTFQNEARPLIAADSIASRLIVLSWPYQADKRAALADQMARLAHLGNRLGEVMTSEANTDLWLVYSHYMEGRWDLVAKLIDAQDRDTLTGRYREHICWVAAMLARERGETDLAWNWLTAILPDSWRVEPGNSDYLSGTRAMLLAAELALDASDLDGAANWLASHDRWREWSGAMLGAADSDLTGARLESLEGRVDAARERAFHSLALAVEPRQPLAQVAAQRFLAELDLATGDYDSAGERLPRARNLATACGVPHEALACRIVEVRLLASRGDLSSAEDLIRDIRNVAEEMRAARLLALLDAIDVESLASDRDLTARELEVLRVVARGCSDAEVAKELYIATRTVNAHMRSIRSKLGVDSRVRAVYVARERHLI